MRLIFLKKQINLYLTREGISPFTNWLESLKDKTMRYRIQERLDRLALGNFGDHKSVGKGVFELKFMFGSGYRVYYGEESDKIILLLCGGDKSSQKKDIKKAHEFWRDYQER
jgi:putative addiction module killer protein